ncbi:unnamed protein product [Brassica rapa subsp. narinosa]
MHLEEVDLAFKGPILEYTEALRVVSMVVGAVNFLCDAAWCLVSALVVFSFKGAHAQSSRFTKIHGSPALWRVGGGFLFKRHNVVGRFGLRYEMQVSYAQLDARSEDGR